MSTCKRCFLETPVGHESPHTCIAALRTEVNRLKKDYDKRVETLIEKTMYRPVVWETPKYEFPPIPPRVSIGVELPKVGETWQYYECLNVPSHGDLDHGKWPIHDNDLWDCQLTKDRILCGCLRRVK